MTRVLFLAKYKNVEVQITSCILHLIFFGYILLMYLYSEQKDNDIFCPKHYQPNFKTGFRKLKLEK